MLLDIYHSCTSINTFMPRSPWRSISVRFASLLRRSVDFINGLLKIVGYGSG